MKKHLFCSVFLFCSAILFSLEAQTKGAIIIASLEGEVTVINNESQSPVPSAQVKAGGLIFDGHTVKTGPEAKVILLMSNGTVSTIKENSTVNIKEFTQEKFDPSKKKLSEMKGEPSSSKTEIDLEMGDMILDVKKLNKRSSFNVQSPVGTAGIRGTIPYFQVSQGNDGSIQQVTSMLKGEIAFTPKGALSSTLLGPGQSLSIGIGANGLLLPPTLGKVPQTILASIESEIEASGGVTGVSSADDSNVPETGGDVQEDEAPSEDELNEADDSRRAAAKGVDDNGSTEVVALEKANLIDLDDPEQLAKADDFVEVAVKSADSFGSKKEKEAEIKEIEAELVAKESKIKELEAQLEVEDGRRADDSDSLLEQINALRNEVESLNAEVSAEKENVGKGSSDFVKVLGENLESTVDVIIEAESLGIKSDDLIEKTAENAENAPITNSNMAKVKDAGVEDLGALQSLISSPENSDETAEFIDEALKADPTEGSSAAVTKLGAVARSTSVADKMKKAKDEGIDPDTIIDSAVAVADLEIQAEKQQAELISSGPEIDPALISLINNAPDEASINAVLEGKENESFYDKLSQLGESRLRALELQNNKTKISTTIKAADSRNKNIEKKRQEAEQLKGGIPADVITALEEADISSSDKVIALKAQYEELYKSEVKTSESISNYIDKLKSAYDLENKDLTSFVEDVNTLETIFTATADNEDFDISDSLIQIEEVAETFELLQSDGEEIDLEAAANLAQNANEIQESKKLLTVAKDEGIDLKTLAKKDIKEQKAINKAVDDQKKSVEKQRLEREQLAGALSQELRATLDAADVSTDELVQAYKDDYATDPLVASIEDYLDARRKAYKLENADLGKLAETSQTLAVLYESTEGNEDFDISDSLAEIEAVQETFKLLSEDGEIDINNFDIDAAANIASNAADIEESKKAIKLAKDAGIDATEIAKKDVDEQKAINKVAEKLEAAGGADAAKNFLASGAADDALQYEKALEDDPDLAGTIATAVTDVSDGNSESGVPPVDLKARIEEKVKDSAKGKLVEEYQDNETYSSIIEENEARAQDISYALSFVDKDSAQEKALFANIDKLDAIISLGSRFKDDEEKITAIFDNLDYANALNELVEEFKNQPSRIELILENPELSPAVLSAYIDFESTGSTALINDLFADSESMKETLSNDGINKLRQKYSDFEEELERYSDRAGEIKSLLEQFEGNSEREVFILENLEDFDSIRGLATRFHGNEKKLDKVFNYEGNLKDLKQVSDEIKKASIIGGQDFLFDNLDRIDLLGAEVELIPTFIHLAKKYENNPAHMDVVYANPLKAEQLLQLSELLVGQEIDLLDNIDQIEVIGKLTEEFESDLRRMEVVFANPELSSDILELLPLLGKEYYDILLSNLEMFDSLSVLIRRAGTDTASIQSLFSHLDFVDELIEISNKYAQLKIDGGQRALFSNLDLFEADPGYFLLAQDDPEFFVLLHNSVSLSKVPSTLAYELLEIGLNKEELIEVLSDIIEGPLVDEPESTSPSDDQTQDEIENYNFLNLTLSHVIEGSIDPELVFSSESVQASNYFEEYFLVYDGLMSLDSFQHDESHHDVHSSLSGTLSEDEALINNENSVMDDKEYDHDITNEGILGGAELTINEGEYDLSVFDYESLVFAATDKLSVSGEILLIGSESLTEAIFISAGSLILDENTKIDFKGESLGIGSFDTLEVINVDLIANDEIALGSLENLVIKNTSLMTTGGTGSDFVHLLAYQQIEIDNLRFSEQLREISMQAMTINLMNLNFPENSTVLLRSEYGPLLDKYPNFGKSVYGRVNFIDNVRYNNNLINSNTTFDQFGSNIHISKIPK